MISPCGPLLQSARERSRLHQASHMWAVGREGGREEKGRMVKKQRI